MQKVIVIGRITSDIETRNAGDSKVCNFSIADNRNWKNKNGEKQEETTFFNCVAWNNLGEVIQEWAKKGNAYYFEGRIKTEQWEAEDGTTRYGWKFIIEKFDFIPANKNESESVPNPKKEQKEANPFD